MDDLKRIQNNQSVKKSRDKKKKENEEKAELCASLEKKSAELEQLLKDRKDELKKIQTMLFNSKIDGNKDFSFIEDDKKIIDYFEIN